MQKNRKEYMKEYRKKNKESIKEQRAQHYQENKERILAQQKVYNKKNEDKISKRNKEYYQTVKDTPEFKLKRKEYNDEYEKRPDVKIKRKEIGKRYRQNNPDKIAERDKVYAKKYPEKVRARILSRQVPLKPACEICGSNENLEKHHWDYNQPLLVNTLCRTCHRIQHIKHFDSPNKFISH